MKQIVLSGENHRGLVMEQTEKEVRLKSLFGLPGVESCPIPEANGLFFLHTDKGRFEADRWETIQVEDCADTLTVLQQTVDGAYQCKTVFTVEPSTGVISRKDYLSNCQDCETVVYACLPRMLLAGDQYDVFGQAAGWCAENQGAWEPLKVGNRVLTNTGGRTTDSATPFACIRHRSTGFAVALHVIPVGDWIIQARRLAGARTSYVVLEAGLSDRNLHMSVAPGETLALPELILYGFFEMIESSSETFQRYLLQRYPLSRISDPVYNTWFFDFDVIEIDRLKEQVLASKELGCKYFVIDAGWFGKGTDWENQVGCWEECQENAFRGRLREFGDFVRSQGMGLGLWMELERACRNTAVYEDHPEWFLDTDAIVYDMANPQVRDYLCSQLTRLVQAYELSWMKLDFNSNMFRDHTGSNYYRYYTGEHQLMEQICQANPSCSFEGCASGGLRSDFNNVLSFYHGHFASDTVHPLECLRIRQGICLRMLPSYAGTWIVLHEVPLGIGSYWEHNRKTRTKILSSGDPWWDYTFDVSADFAAKVNMVGEFGLSGDVTSLSAETSETIRKAVAFYSDHQKFLGRSICHCLTKLQDINDITGWTAVQQENIDGEGSILFVYRLVDDAESFIAFPKNINDDAMYLIRREDDSKQLMTGAEINCTGIYVQCPKRYSAKIVEVIPVKNGLSNVVHM